RCFTLHTPRDLNDAEKIRELFDFLRVEIRQNEIIFGGRKNKSIGYSNASILETEKECAFVLEQLPASYLKIFQREPYANCDWNFRIRNPVGVEVTRL
ncbi:MAG: hypothetical protein ACREFE_15070, partial [Limisphaerales bacterium]